MTEYIHSDDSTASQETARQQRLAAREADAAASKAKVEQRKADKASGAKIVRPSRWRPGK